MPKRPNVATKYGGARRTAIEPLQAADLTVRHPEGFGGTEAENWDVPRPRDEDDLREFAHDHGWDWPEGDV